MGGKSLTQVTAAVLVCVLAAFAAVGLTQLGAAGAPQAQQLEPPNGVVAELPVELSEFSRGFYSAFDPDGNPVLGRPSGSSSEVRSCLDRECQDVALVVVDVWIKAMLIEPSSGDLLLFGRSFSSGLIVAVRCARPDDDAGYCADSQESSDLQAPAEFRNSAAFMDAVLDVNGLPVVVYAEDRDSFNETPVVYLVRCADPGCAQIASREVVHDDLDRFAFEAAVALDALNRPFVAIGGHGSGYYAEREPLLVVHCSDAGCTDTSRQIFPSASLGLSLEVGVDWLLTGLAMPGLIERPVIALQTRAPARLALIDCHDFDCVAPTTSIVKLGDPAHSAVESAASLIGETTSHDLFIYGNGVMAICPDAACQAGVVTRPVAPAYNRQNPQPTLTFDDSGGFIATGTAEYVTVCESVDCRLAETAQVQIDGRCPNDGSYTEISVTLNNLSSEPVQIEMRTGAVIRLADVGSEQTYLQQRIRVTGRPEGPVAVVVSIDGADVASSVFGFACQEQPTTLARASCLSGAGRVDVMVVGDPVRVSADYRVQLGDDERLVTIDELDSVGNGFWSPNRFAGSVDEIVTFTRRPDGVLPVQVVDVATGTTVYDSEVTIDCDTGAGPPEQVNIALSCLAGGGRIDTTIVESAGAEGTWRLQVGSLSPRERTVAALDWWRSPITGRPDGPIDVEVFRNDVLVESRTLDVACDGDVPVVSDEEVVAISACRGGSGYILFQFVNDSASPKSWVIEFAGVPNRSTTAAPYGASVRAVTGRSSGAYQVTINGVRQPPVFVAC